jgi:hypothetical protein
VQASAFVAVALFAAVPLGIAAGTTLWRLRVNNLGIVDERQIPWFTLAVVVVIAVVIANLVAALAGRTTTTTPAGPILRDE